MDTLKQRILRLAIVAGFCGHLSDRGWTDDAEWTMPARNYESTRFSDLNQINTTTVTNLKVAWTFDTGVNRGQEAAPIVVSNTMYVVTPFPNILYALDLRTNGAMKWKYEPNPKSAAQ